jgi:hypothetical protein
MNGAQMAGTGAVGHCDPETQTIGLAGTQSDDSMQDTFLHEVSHAIVHVMDLKETESEENYVRRLATGLCTVWNNNPAAVERVGLVASSFQFFTHLAAVFAEEVGGCAFGIAMAKCRMIYLLRRFDFEARSCIQGTSRRASRTPPTPGFLVAASSHLRISA